MTELGAKIRAILAQHGRLTRDASTLGDDDDLYAAGMTSHASVNVMLALEGELAIEFPDTMLTRGGFESVRAIAAAVAQLSAKPSG